MAGIEHAGPGDLTFVANAGNVTKLAGTKASAGDRLRGCPDYSPRLISKNPYLTYARPRRCSTRKNDRPRAFTRRRASIRPRAGSGGVHVGAYVVRRRTRPRRPAAASCTPTSSC